MAKARRAMKQQLRTLWIDIARDLLYDAVQSWSGYDMTGNTINSYACAIYEDGKILHAFSARDVGIEENPTANYSYPGDYIYFWHQRTLNESLSDYAEYENGGMGVVRPYRAKRYEFQNVGRGNGQDDAKQFLNNFKAGKGLQICIVVGVPYAEYLQNVRKLEVLQETFGETKQIADANINSVRPLVVK